MQKFLKSKEYQILKTKYESKYFKLAGDYAWYDGDKIVTRTANKVAEYFKNKKVTISETTEDDDGESHVKIKSKTFYQVWSEDPKMKEYEEVVFNCDVKGVKDYQFNLFDGFAVAKYKPSKEVKLDILKTKLLKINDHIASLCNYNDSHVKLVKWYIAHILKKPHELPDICLVFISKEGVGKDLFAELVENLLGSKYTFNVDKLDSIVGKFNTTMGGKIFGVVNETDPLDSSQRRDNIKFVISAKKLNIEGKHKDPVKTINYCRLVFFANRYCAFPVEKGSRRPYVMKCSDKYLPENIGAEANKKHFTELADIINDRDVQKLFYDELMKIDIDKFNFKEIEKSDLHKTLEESAIPPIVEFVTSIAYDHTKEKKFTIHTVKLLELYTDFLKKRNMKFECSQKNFNIELQQGFKVEKYASMGKPKFRFDIEQVKSILLKEYKVDVDKDTDDDDDDDKNDDDEYEYGVDKSDLSVKSSTYEQLIHYKKLVRDLEAKFLEEVDAQMKKALTQPKQLKTGIDKYVSDEKICKPKEHDFNLTLQFKISKSKENYKIPVDIIEKTEVAFKDVCYNQDISFTELSIKADAKVVDGIINMYIICRNMKGDTFNMDEFKYDFLCLIIKEDTFGWIPFCNTHDEIFGYTEEDIKGEKPKKINKNVYFKEDTKLPELTTKNVTFF